MKAYVVVEGAADAEIFESLLRSHGHVDVKVLYANGRSSVLSLARTLLLAKTLPVLVAVDLDDGDEEEVRDVMETGLGQVAPARRWKCVIFAPTLVAELLMLMQPLDRRRLRSKGTAFLQSLLNKKDFLAKVRALQKLKDAFEFIQEWNEKDRASATA